MPTTVRSFSRHTSSRMASLRLAAWLVVYKLLFWNIAVLSLGVLPLNREAFEVHVSFPETDPPTFETRFATWDAAHYLYLVDHGYHKGSPSCAFYPLWPATIYATASILHMSPFLTGLLLANVLSICALLLFHRFVEGVTDSSTALLATVLLCSLPGAMYFSMIYTESLYLCLLMAFFLLLYKGSYVPAACVGFMLPLTKAMGVFLILPTTYVLWVKRRLRRTAWLPAALLCGYALYFVLMWTFTGHPGAGFSAQSNYPNAPSIGNILDLWTFCKRLISVNAVHSVTGSAIDRIMFILCMISVALQWRRDSALAIYGLVAGYVPAAATGFVSYSRQVLMCFPMCIIAAELLNRPQLKWCKWHVVSFLAIVQWCFLVRYMAFEWAAG